MRICRACRRTAASSACAMQQAGFQAGTAVNMVAAQDRVFGEELPTDGYATLRLLRLVLVHARGAC